MRIKVGVHEGRRVLARKRVEKAKSHSSAKSIAITRYLKDHPNTKRSDVTATATQHPSGRFVVYVLTKSRKK